MSEPAEELRELVAAEYNLPHGAVDFLRGETLAELEESAVQFARLREKRSEQGPAPNLLTAAATAKAERQRALVNLFTGRAPEQPRDKRGRFASGGFDGGARQSPPPRAETHDAWLVRTLRSRAADSGAAF